MEDQPRSRWAVPPLLLVSVATLGIQLHGFFTVDLGISDVFLGLYLLHVRRIRAPRWLWLSAGAFAATCSIAAARGIAAGGDRLTWSSTRMVGVLVVLTYLLVIGDVSRSIAARHQLVQAFVLGVLSFNVLFVLPVVGDAMRHPFPTAVRGRLAAGMYDQNSNATLLAAAALLALTTGSFRRVPGLVASAVGVGLLVLTYSRTGYLAFAVGLVVWLAWEALARRRQIGAMAAAVVVAVALAVVAGVPGKVRAHFAGRPDTVSTRASFIHQAIDYFEANPLFGAGFGAAQTDLGVVIHATTFSLLGETGAVGLAAFLVLVGSVTWKGLRVALRRSAPADARGLLCVSLCLLVGSFGIDGLLHRHWWVVLGLVLGTTYAVPTDAARPPDPAATTGERSAHP